MKRILSIALLAILVSGCDSELKEIVAKDNQQVYKDINENAGVPVKKEKQFLLMDVDERGGIVRYYDSQTGVVCYRYIGDGHLACIKMNQGANL